MKLANFGPGLTDLLRLRKQARDGVTLRIRWEMRNTGISHEEAKIVVKKWVAAQLSLKPRNLYWKVLNEDLCIKIINTCGTYCTHCGEQAELTTEDKIAALKSNNPNKYFWICESCEAWCGIHKNTSANAPLGLPANENLRKLRQQTHYEFDQLWKRKMERDGCSSRQARNSGYKWLSEQMGICVEECHIALFNEDQCKEAIEICRPFREAIQIVC